MLVDGSVNAPDSHLLTESLKSEIRDALEALTLRESEVIVHYYGLEGHAPMTLEDLGEKFQLTRERVRQIKEKATRRLRGSKRTRILKNYL